MDNMSDLLQSLITLLNSSNKTFLSIFLSIIISVFILIILISILLEPLKKLKEFINEILFNNDKNHLSKNSITNKLDIDDRINKICKNSLEKNKFDRICVYQFHNGMLAASGLPFQFVVLTNEITANGIANSNELGNHNDLRIFAQIIKQIIGDTTLNIDTKSLSEPIVSILNDNGTKKIAAIIIHDAVTPSVLIGMLIFEMVTSDNFNIDNISIDNELESLSIKLSGILCNTWGNCIYCEKNKKCKIKHNRDITKNCDDFSPSIKDI